MLLTLPPNSSRGPKFPRAPSAAANSCFQPFQAPCPQTHVHKTPLLSTSDDFVRPSDSLDGRTPNTHAGESVTRCAYGTTARPAPPSSTAPRIRRPRIRGRPLPPTGRQTRELPPPTTGPLLPIFDPDESEDAITSKPLCSHLSPAPPGDNARLPKPTDPRPRQRWPPRSPYSRRSWRRPSTNNLGDPSRYRAAATKTAGSRSRMRARAKRSRIY